MLEEEKRGQPIPNDPNCKLQEQLPAQLDHYTHTLQEGTYGDVLDRRPSQKKVAGMNAMWAPECVVLIKQLLASERSDELIPLWAACPCVLQDACFIQIHKSWTGQESHKAEMKLNVRSMAISMDTPIQPAISRTPHSTLHAPTLA